MPTFSLLFLPPIKSSIHEEFWGFSVGSRETASTDEGTGNRERKDIAKEGPCDSEKSSKRKFTGLESKSKEDESEQNPINKSKRNRRKERKKKKDKEKKLKVKKIWDQPSARSGCNARFPAGGGGIHPPPVGDRVKQLSS